MFQRCKKNLSKIDIPHNPLSKKPLKNPGNIKIPGIQNEVIINDNIPDNTIPDNKTKTNPGDASREPIIKPKETNISKEVNETQTKPENNKTDTKTDTKTETKTDTKPDKKVKTNPEEPLKYYFKKDKPDLKWPSNQELYNPDNFKTEEQKYKSIKISLGTIFPEKDKKKTDIQDMLNGFKTKYGLEKLDNPYFKDNVLEIIYDFLESFNIEIQRIEKVREMTELCKQLNITR